MNTVLKSSKRYILIGISVLVSCLSNAQITSCDADHFHHDLYDHNPEYHRSIDRFNMNASIPLESFQERVDQIYTVPVVVHIIHNGEPIGTGVNITDAQVQSAITALNNDWRKVSGTNGFGNGVDVGVQFCLAVRDPNGNPTTGINRVNGSSVPNYATSGIAGSGAGGADEGAVKALSTWPRTSYVNIWVVSEIDNNDGGAGTQGYAYFPFNSPLDGIVILYNAFGTVGNLKSYTNLNRTLSHEMGHVFSLYHTFNETTACGAETSCTTQGDRVCDTPPTTLNSSCSSPACSGTQQVANYMDYTSQSCQNMFTDGQKTRIRNSLLSDRNSLLSSLGCMPVFSLDAGVTAIASPSGISCSSSYNPQVTLSNFGSTTLTSAQIIYNIDGTGANTTFNWTGSLASGAAVQVTLPSVSAALGAHTFYCWTGNINGTADQNSSNNQSTSNFTVANGATLTLSVTLDLYGGENTWQIVDANGVTVDNGGPFANNASGTVVTENICLPAGCYTLRFIDTYGDGQGFPSGGFTLYSPTNTVLATASNNWGNLSEQNFCVTVPTSNTPPTASFTVADNIICTNATASFTNTSSNAPTNYSWSFPGGSPSTSSAANPPAISYSTAGTYNVVLTVSNANGSNTYTCNSCITVTGGPSVTFSGSNPTCNGSNNGSITPTASGSYTPFTYDWGGGVTTANRTNLTAGNYSLTVTNSQGCSTSANTTLTQPSALIANLTKSNQACTGGFGNATVAPTGGTPPYMVNWSNGQSGMSIGFLNPGNYTVTIADANGCSTSQTFNIAAATAMNIAVTSNPILCNGGTGGATASVTNGTGTFTYSWSNGQTGATINGLPAGTYTVTATNSNGCSGTASVTLSNPPLLGVVGTVNSILCAGNLSGSITLAVSGGTGNRTYAWSNGATSANINNLGAGNYSVVVTDANGCTKSQSFTVTAPQPITINGVVTNIACGGQSTGSVVTNVTGGTGNKNYLWSTGATSPSINNLSAGSYSVMITDANGCSVSQSFAVSSPSPLQTNLQSFNTSCGGETGSAIVAPSGGTPPYNVNWNGANPAALPVGSYGVTVTDNNNCSATSSFTIQQSSSLGVVAQASDVSCYGLSDGSANALISGGTAPYTYTWSNGIGTSAISGLSAGVYTVNVTDSQGCTGSAMAAINQPQNITADIQSNSVSCFGMSDGSIIITAAGGTGSLNMTWNNGETGFILVGLSADTYTGTITDANGCNTSVNASVTEPSALSANVVLVSSETCSGNDGAVSISIDGGNPDYIIQWSNGSSETVATQLSAGDYTVDIADMNGCSVNLQVNVPYDCTQQLATTRLIDSDCGITGVETGYILTCVTVPGAQSYQWKFANVSGQILSESNSTGPQFFLSSVPGVTQGAVIQVRVKVMINGVWGPYGELCTVSTAPNVVNTTQLIASDCGTTIASWDGSVQAEPIDGAVNYEWHITGIDYEWTTFTVDPILSLSETMLFTPGASYQIAVRCSLGNGIVTDWGATCSISFDISLTIETQGESEGTGLTIYPNPSNGETVFISNGNKTDAHTVSNVIVYTTQGQIVYRNTIPMINGLSSTPINFGRSLAAGVYLVRVVTGTQLTEAKMIVH